jgi:hypothetical protein
MTNQTKPYEPLTSENAALVLVDHQVGLMTGVRDYSTGCASTRSTLRANCRMAKRKKEK